MYYVGLMLYVHMANTMSAASLPIAMFPCPDTFVYVVAILTPVRSPHPPMHVYNPSTEYRICMEICICMFPRNM